MIMDTVTIAVVLLPRSIAVSIPKRSSRSESTGILAFNIVFHTVPTTALDEITGIKIAALAILPIRVCFLDATSTENSTDNTTCRGTTSTMTFSVFITARCIFGSVSILL